MTRYAIGIGSNIGDRLAHLTDAANRLGAAEGLVSALYETEPVGGPDQDPFLNAVVVVDSDLPPHEMLVELQAIEQSHDRERTVRWGPRTLDLDIIASDGLPVDTPGLTVPHPRASQRAFVLRPLVDVWPDADVGGSTAREALNRLDTHEVDFLARKWVPSVPPWPGRALVGGQFAIFIATALALAVDGRLPEGEVTAFNVVGALVAMVGLFLAFVSSRRLGAAMTANPIPKPGASLVVTGPFRYVRHPIYGGVILVLLGTALFLDSLWGLAVAATLIPYLWAKSSYEERQLRMRYAGYRAYMAVVHRRLIPFVI